MKTTYQLFILLVISISTYSRDYYTFTARQDGNWDNSGTWNMVLRKDHVQKDKFIIPSGIVVTGSEDVNSMGFTDVEIMIAGELKLGASVSLHFGNNSKIEVLQTGSINATGASQQIYIGSVVKYTGNKNKILSGPVYADFSTGPAPQGFAAYTILTFNFLSFSASVDNNTASLKWSASNDNRNTVYEVQQRINANEWTTIGSVNATANAGAVNSYGFESNEIPKGLISYRIRQVDAEGREHHSSIVSIKPQEAAAAVNIFSSEKNISVEFAEEVKNTVDVKVMNLNGHMVSNQTFENPSSKLTINLSNFKSGDYVVYVSDNANIETIKKVFIK